MSSLTQLLDRLTQFVSFKEPTNDKGRLTCLQWETIASGLLDAGLREAVEGASGGERDSQAKKLREIERILSDDARKQIEAYFACETRFDSLHGELHRVDWQRVYKNARMAVAGAQAAVAALQAAPDRVAQGFQFAAELLGCPGGGVGLRIGVGQCDPLSTVTAIYKQVGHIAPMASFYRWVLYWLNASATDTGTTHRIPVAFVRSDTKEGFLADLCLTSLPWDCPGLIEHPGMALLPLGATLLSTVAKAWSTEASQLCIQWELQAYRGTAASPSGLRDIAHLDGDSLAGAAHVGFAVVKRELEYDRECLIMATVSPNGVMREVGEEYAKLEAAARAGIRRVGIARDQRPDRLPATYPHGKVLDVPRLKNLADAVELATGRPSTIVHITYSGPTPAGFPSLAELWAKLNISGGIPTAVQTSFGVHYAAFDGAGAGVRYALRFRDALRYYDWRALGVEKTPPLRTVVVTGPDTWARQERKAPPDAAEQVLADSRRIDPAQRPGDVFVSEAVAALAESEEFFFCPCTQHTDSLTSGLFTAYWSREGTAIRDGYRGPLYDDQYYKREEALRRFAYTWLVLDQLPVGSWGRSIAPWMSQVWRDIPTMPLNAAIEDEGGFETTVLNLQLLAEIVGPQQTLQKIGRNAIDYIAKRHAPMGFGTLDISRHGYEVAPHPRHTALVVWLIGTIFKDSAVFDPDLRELFKAAVITLLAGDPGVTSHAFLNDRNPLLLYLAAWHAVQQVLTDEWKGCFGADDLLAIKETWEHCEQKLLNRALRSNYEKPQPEQLRRPGERIHPLIVPYGEFVRMEGYSVLACSLLVDARMEYAVRSRLAQAIEYILLEKHYLGTFEDGRARYTRDSLRPKIRGPKPYFVFDPGNALQEDKIARRPEQTHPDLGIAAMAVRILRSPKLVQALWGEFPLSQLNQVRCLLMEDLTELFDRYWIEPKLYGLTHGGLIAGILAGDSPRLKAAVVDTCSHLVEQGPLAELKNGNLRGVLSERHIDELSRTTIADDANSTPKVQMATHSVARLLLDRLRPGRYLKDNNLSAADISSISKQTRAVYDEDAFTEKYDQKWGKKADSSIFKPFLDLLSEKTTILDIGSGPGQYAVKFVEAGHSVELLDASKSFLKLAGEKLDRVPQCVWQALPTCDVLDPQSRLTMPTERVYGAVWCSALLVHVPPKLLPEILKWLYSHLAEGGILFANLLIGNPRVFARDGRYFSYIGSPDEFEHMLLESGFRTEFTLKKRLTENTYGEPALDLVWANFYARRGSRLPGQDDGSSATLLTSLAFERSVDDFQTGPVARRRAQFVVPQVDRLEEFLRLEGFPANGVPNVLDAGCGPGDFVIVMAQRKWIACGVDVSHRMVSVARRRSENVATYASFRVGDMRSLPSEWNQYFDAVICVSALQHVPHFDNEERSPLLQTLRGFARVLKPKGLLRLDIRIGADSGYDPDLRYIQAFPSENGVLKLLFEAGFEMICPPVRRELEPMENAFQRPLAISFSEIWMRKRESQY